MHEYDADPAARCPQQVIGLGMRTKRLVPAKHLRRRHDLVPPGTRQLARACGERGVCATCAHEQNELQPEHDGKAGGEQAEHGERS